MTISQMPVQEEDHDKLMARAQPIRIVSIDDVTIGQLVSLLFKLLIASIPVALVIWGIRAGLVYIAQH